MTSNLKYRFWFIIAIVISCYVSQTEQGLFDSFNDMFEVYDGAQCALNIIEYGLRYMNTPVCCIYWKVRSVFNYFAQKQCEHPENLRKILAGEMIDSYLDLSRLECRETLDNSKQCNTFWITIITILLGQTLLLIIFFITSLILIHWYMKHRKMIQKQTGNKKAATKMEQSNNKQKQRKKEQNYWNKTFNSLTETSSLTISDHFDEEEEEGIKEMNHTVNDNGQNDKFIMILGNDYHRLSSTEGNQRRNDYLQLPIK